MASTSKRLSLRLRHLLLLAAQLEPTRLRSSRLDWRSRERNRTNTNPDSFKENLNKYALT